MHHDGFISDGRFERLWRTQLILISWEEALTPAEVVTRGSGVYGSLRRLCVSSIVPLDTICIHFSLGFTASEPASVTVYAQVDSPAAAKYCSELNLQGFKPSHLTLRASGTKFAFYSSRVKSPGKKV
jgi:hypothetical protein